MSTVKQLVTAEELLKSFKDEFKTKVTNTRIESITRGKEKTTITYVWMTIDNSVYKKAVKHLFTFDEYPHFAVSSGYDKDKTIDIIHHFSLFHGERGRELSLNMTVSLPKSKPEIETITDLIPGALIAEQEKQEMLGIKVKGIPKDKRAFISHDFPKGVYPWRKDEKGPGKMVRNLHEGDKL